MAEVMMQRPDNRLVPAITLHIKLKHVRSTAFQYRKNRKLQAVKKHTVDEKISEPLTAIQQSSERRGHAHDIILSKTVHGASTTKPLMRRGLKKPSKTSNPYAQPIAPIKTV